MFLANNKAAAENTITVNQSKSNSYSSVLNQANAITANLATAKNILNQQISYSNIIMGLAQVLPSGVVLDGTLSLSKDTINVPIVIKMRAKTTDDIAKLKANFQESSIFTNYNLQSMTSNPNDLTGYPVAVTIGITINKSAAL
jgi:Tfp pilus assembly protein PilN